jgi:hypothetical protein
MAGVILQLLARALLFQKWITLKRNSINRYSYRNSLPCTLLFTKIKPTFSFHAGILKQGLFTRAIRRDPKSALISRYLPAVEENAGLEHTTSMCGQKVCSDS